MRRLRLKTAGFRMRGVEQESEGKADDIVGSR